ncbi:MAG: ComF family protein [Clostridia bacterium]|nr:ComF family protein [Clostridia bacterium]
MKTGGRIGRIREILRQILYPEGAICLRCGAVSGGECLCPACRRDLRQGDVLESWETREVAGVLAWSIRPHRGVARDLVLALKHRAEARAAGELAALLRQRPAAFPALSPDTVVTWVPMPPGRKRERCIDHGQVLADRVAAELGLSSRALLIRRGNSAPQARLNRAGRERNLRNAYVPGEPIDFPVLLVDDVLTTGTTARRCVEALRAGGAAEITVLTMTRAAG